VFLELSGLRSTVPSVELDPNHRIIVIEEDTARRLWMRNHFAEHAVGFGAPLSPAVMHRTLDLCPGQCSLEVTFEIPKDQLNSLSLFLKKYADSASLACRLCHRGSGAIRFSAYEYVGFVPESGILGFDESLRRRSFSYEVDESAAAALCRRWSDALNISKSLISEPEEISTHLRIAIERFNSSFSEKIPADQLLDYMIALEACCSRENDAVSFRVPLRTATLIGANPSDRESVFKEIADAYKQRSHLSHGRDSTLTSSDLTVAQTYLLGLQEYLLRVIHFFIQAEIKGIKRMPYWSEGQKPPSRLNVEGGDNGSYRAAVLCR